jgi:hypothetical protein
MSIGTPMLGDCAFAFLSGTRLLFPIAMLQLCVSEWLLALSEELEMLGDSAHIFCICYILQSGELSYAWVA